MDGPVVTMPAAREPGTDEAHMHPPLDEASRHGTRSKSGVTKPKLKTGEAAPEDEDAKPAPPKKQAPAPKKDAPAPRSESPSQGSSGSGSDGEEKNRMQGLLTALLMQCPEDAEGAKPKAASRKRKPSATPRSTVSDANESIYETYNTYMSVHVNECKCK